MAAPNKRSKFRGTIAPKIPTPVEENETNEPEANCKLPNEDNYDGKEMILIQVEKIGDHYLDIIFYRV